MQGFSYIKNTVTLAYDPEKCMGCGRCVEVCPHEVFVLHGKKACMSNRDACMECGACMVNCAAGAISVDAGVGCAAGLILQWFAEMFPRIRNRYCCSK